MAIGKSGDRTARTQGGFIVSYSPEYLRFRSNPMVLDEIAEKTGGKVLKKDTTADEIYRSRRHPKRSSRPIFDWFLVALACLLPADVAFRRIQIDRNSFAALFGLGARKGRIDGHDGHALVAQADAEKGLRRPAHATSRRRRAAQVARGSGDSLQPPATPEVKTCRGQKASATNRRPADCLNSNANARQEGKS